MAEFLKLIAIANTIVTTLSITITIAITIDFVFAIIVLTISIIFISKPGLTGGPYASMSGF